VVININNSKTDSVLANKYNTSQILCGVNHLIVISVYKLITIIDNIQINILGSVDLSVYSSVALEKDGNRGA